MERMVNPIKRQIMFEKVNPCHPDKVADRIAGAIVDLAYTKNKNRWSNESSAKLDLSTAEGRQRWAQANPKVAVEVLLGHGKVNRARTSDPLRLIRSCAVWLVMWNLTFTP